mgnify:CR=1 FL=1
MLKSKYLPNCLCILIYVTCKIYIRNISDISILLCNLCDYSRNDSFVVFQRKDPAQILKPLQTSVRVSKYGIIARDSSAVSYTHLTLPTICSV